MEKRLDEYYKKLEKAFFEQNFEEIVNNLKYITKCPLRNSDFVFQCIYLAIKNNYHKEIDAMLKNMFVGKKDKIKFSVLENAIKNQENFLELSDEEKNVYYTAILWGRFYYDKKDLYTAYDIYSWAYYLTNQPIFLYYIGKMLFKKGKYKDAEEYLKNYIKVGDRKLSKAYLYLAAIEKIRYNYKAAKNYSIYIEETDRVYSEFFEIEEIYDKKSEENDIEKIKVQNEFLKLKRTTN